MQDKAELTIIMVSYNTRDLTLAAIRTCLDTTVETSFRLVVLDNASTDGSADAIAAAVADDPRVTLIRSEENLGFARANNIVARTAQTAFVLLLNPDTECHAGAVDALMRFARETPEAGIWGGRTVFPDGSLNPSSCAMRITLWSMICRTTGLYGLFKRSALFNPEEIGGWSRDSVRQVDIVVGCFLLIGKDLWDRLGGFDPKYFMYGEDADLCLRARAMGYRPMITPEAQIMHIYGASTQLRSDKIVAVARARATLIRDHLPGWQAWPCLWLMWLGAGLRHGVSHAGRSLIRTASWVDRARIYGDVWQRRRDWLAGYGTATAMTGQE